MRESNNTQFIFSNFFICLIFFKFAFILNDFDMEARIIDISSGRTIGSLYDTLVLNKGMNDRLQVGDLLTLQKPDILLTDPVAKTTNGEKFSRTLGMSTDPVETFSGVRFGLVLIYRVFEDTSFGIILATEEIVRLEDKLVTP